MADVVGGPEEMGFKLTFECVSRVYQSLGWPEGGSSRGQGAANGEGKGSVPQGALLDVSLLEDAYRLGCSPRGSKLGGEVGTFEAEFTLVRARVHSAMSVVCRCVLLKTRQL